LRLLSDKIFINFSKEDHKNMMKDYIAYFVVALFGFYFLYQKGLVLADFNSITPAEAHKLLSSEDDNVTILDVRTHDEIKQVGYIEKAIVIPLQNLELELEKLTSFKDKKIIVYCASGNRSVSASRILSNSGFYVYNLKGGIARWKSDGYKTKFH
jgi:rhodanese-related sulfurtransferase